MCRSLPGNGSIGGIGGVVRVVGESAVFVFVIAWSAGVSVFSTSSMERSTYSSHSPRIHPEWIAAATGSESSV